jgi:hypothetical protein
MLEGAEVSHDISSQSEASEAQKIRVVRDSRWKCEGCMTGTKEHPMNERGQPLFEAAKEKMGSSHIAKDRMTMYLSTYIKYAQSCLDFADEDQVLV